MKKTPHEIFGPLGTRLFEIKSGRAKNSFPEATVLVDGVYDCFLAMPESEALANIDLAIETINEINTSAEELSRSYNPNMFAGDVVDFEIIKEFTPEEVVEEKAKFVARLKVEVNRYLIELEKIKEELLKRIEAKQGSQREKIKLNLSVDEIGALFRGLEEAKIIPERKHTALSRIIAQTFMTKSTDDLKSNNLKNQLDAPTEPAINSVIGKLNDIALALKNLKGK